MANASPAVARLRDPFRRCYQSQLKTNPNMRGTVTLIATLDARGVVTKVSSELGPGADGLSAIVPCLKAAVFRARFAPPEDGRSTVAIPITFATQK